MAVVGIVAIVWNYEAFGPLGALVMLGVEFTAIVFAALGFIVVRGLLNAKDR